MAKKKDDIEGFRDFLVERELSDSTIESYIYTIQAYYKFNGGILTKKAAIDFKNHLLEKNSAKTVNIRICGLEAFFNYKNVSLGIKRIPIQKRTYVQNVISIEQFNYLIDRLRKDGKEKHAVWFMLIAKTGARVSEFRKFTKADLDKGYKDLWTKGKIRRIMFPKSLIDEVSEYYKDLSPEASLCQSRVGNTVTTGGVNSILKSCAERYDIPKEVMHVHGLRHLFAVEFLKRNNNIALLADLMGHSGVNTTMIYTRLSQDQQQEALDAAMDW